MFSLLSLLDLSFLWVVVVQLVGAVVGKELATTAARRP